MTQSFTRLVVTDNSGAKELMCIKVLGDSRRRYATVSGVIVASIKKALSNGKVKKGQVVKTAVFYIYFRAHENIPRVTG